MKKLPIIVLCMALLLGLLSGCSKQQSQEVQSNQNNQSTNTSNQESSKKEENNSVVGVSNSKVLKPNDLLSSKEATEIVGIEVVIDDTSLEIDELGVSNTYYEFDYRGSTFNALFLLKQNAATQKDALRDGATAESDYEYLKKICGEDVRVLSGLGDKAFVQPTTAQVNVLYGDYYFLVAFDHEDLAKGEEININIAKKIIENIKRK